MSTGFIERVCDLIQQPRGLTGAERDEVLVTFEDTMACAHAGWHEPVTQSALKVYRGSIAPLIDGSSACSVEHAAFLHAMAGHALDYDDVQLTGITHPSVPIVPALLAVAASRAGLESRVAPAFAIGLAVTVAIGRAFGFSHYDKGWHATGTLGPVASAAALSHLLSLDRTRSRHALAMAAAQAGGLQRNFGAMAKPAQAGLAAAAGVRSALLAEAGVTGDSDAFGPRGYFDLYAGAVRGDDPAAVPIEIDVFAVARKLYPCCYMNHRLIAAAFAARDLLGGEIPADADIHVTAPYGSTVPLRVPDPRTGLEAKFCGPYSVAVALAQGTVTTPDFEDEAVYRPAIRDLMRRITLTEEPLVGETPIGLDHGVVRLNVRSRGRQIAFAEIDAYPASPRRPATAAEMAMKIADCLGIYARRANDAPTQSEFRAALRVKLGMPASGSAIRGEREQSPGAR